MIPKSRASVRLNRSAVSTGYLIGLRIQVVPGKRKNERPLTEEGEDAMEIDSDHLQVSISDPTLKPKRIPFDASKRADHT